MWCNLIVLVYCFIYISYCVFATGIGEKCSLPSGESGKCTPITNCSHAENSLHNKTLDSCGFDVEQIVCCVEKLNRNTSTLRAISTNKNHGALSRQKCLRQYPKPRYPSLVTGGVPSLAKEFPHMAIIGYGDKKNMQWQCGGSLISLNFVLTAAHCLTSSKFGVAKWVRLGDLDLSTDEDVSDPHDFGILRRIPHPDYKPPARYNDIALVELDSSVLTSPFMSPACLYTEKEINFTTMTATGWGKTEYNEEASSILMKVDLDYATNKKCNKYYKNIPMALLPNGVDDERQVCAGGVVGKDTCQGDSGGPLQVFSKERTFVIQVHTIIGITSFGKVCGLSTSPAVYTRVSYYVPWIEDVIWPNETVQETGSVLIYKPLN